VPILGEVKHAKEIGHKGLFRRGATVLFPGVARVFTVSFPSWCA